MSNNEEKKDSSENPQEQEIKPYQKKDTEKYQKAIEKSLNQIEQERNEMDKVQRFGFFSIPYPSTVGDKAYSRNKEYSIQVVDRKVITEKRGIYTTIPKTGKTRDVYFEPIEPVPESEIEKRKKYNNDQLEKRIQEIRQKKEKKDVKIPFKPSGPQILRGYYEMDGPFPVNDGPLYKEKNKFSRIGPDKKIITEKRGIYSNPTKLGVLQPSEYFGFPFTDDELMAKYNQIGKEEKEKYQKQLLEKHVKNPNYRKPFSPASFKCEPFTSDMDTYCNYDEETKKKRMEEYRDYKKNGRPKYKKLVPSGSCQHIRAFVPAKLISTGRDGLFNDDLYKLPELPKEEKKLHSNMSMREIRLLEKKNCKEVFRNNRLMDHSTFSPPINSYATNLRREFPTIFKGSHL